MMNCPICGTHMDVRDVKGITIDICPEHGAWLDKGELEKIMEKSKQDGWGDGFVESLNNWRYW